MPKLTIQSEGSVNATVDVAAGTRLVNALEDAGVDQLHSCGGVGRCTTCRVVISQGEPTQITDAERAVLAERSLTGVRLSCQLTCDHDMTVSVISRFAGSGKKDAGPRPKDQIEPPPVWGKK
jgi:ferredoxin